MRVQFVAVLLCSKNVLNFITAKRLSALSLHVLHVHVWHISSYSSPPTKSENLIVRSVGFYDFL